MAQIGGLYSFLKMVFGTAINAIQYKIMLIDILNKFNRRKLEDLKSRKKIQRLEKIFPTSKNQTNVHNQPEESKLNDGGEKQYLYQPQDLINS